MKKYKTDFMHSYRYALPKEELELIWKRSYQYARRLKKQNPEEFLTASGEIKKISNKAETLAKEYVWALKNDKASRVKLYYEYDRKISALERETQATYNTYIDRLNYKSKDNIEGSFMEKYDNENHLYENKTISDALEEYLLDKDKSKLNEWLAGFKDKFSNEMKTKEQYETMYGFER